MSDLYGPVPDDAVYYVDHAAGEIRAYGIWSVDQPEPPVRPGLTRVRVSQGTYAALQHDPEGYWIEDDLAVARTVSPIALSATSIAADGQDELVISDVPTGSHLRITGAVSARWQQTNSAVITITCTTPGRLRIEIRCPPPYLAWRGTVDAT